MVEDVNGINPSQAQDISLRRILCTTLLLKVFVYHHVSQEVKRIFEDLQFLENVRCRDIALLHDLLPQSVFCERQENLGTRRILSRS